MNRRRFLARTALGATLFLPHFARSRAAMSQKSARRDASFELEEITVRELQLGLKSKQYTSVSLTETYLARIKEIDQHGPRLNSVIETNPEALALAHQLDREAKNGQWRGPLHGIPILIKDNIATHDRMMTTAGSLALNGSVPLQDSFVVHQLRRAGAVLLGKTNLSEWANFRSTRSTSGWSGRGGLTRNPYALDRNPSGSSAGSGVAAAANFCAVAIGTETDGSILSPSSVNGLVGIKPTIGLVSRAGIVPIGHSQDTAGPMCRSVTDAAIVLGVLAGPDPQDPTTVTNAKSADADYTRYLDPAGLRGARLGVARKFFDIHPGAAALIEAAIGELMHLGAVIVDPADLPSHGKLDDAEFEVLLYEFKADLNTYLASLGPEAPVRSLEQVIAFNDQNSEKEMPYFGQEILLKAQAKGSLEESAYRDALAKCQRLSRKEGIDAIMDEHRLDALIAPTSGPAHLTDLVYGDRDIGGSMTPAAVAGYPSITVPAGFVSGLPVGLSFFGRAFSEATLLRLAFAFEQSSRARRAPRFLPTARV